MSILFAVACMVAGYLIGNVQTAVLVSRRRFHDDVRKHGSGNAGTTNMIRVYGWVPGLVTFVGDCLKGIVAVLIGRALMGEYGGYLAGACAVIGHCYPAFGGFRGGKGVASSLGIALVTYPRAGLVIVLVVAVLFILWRRVSVCSLTGALIFLVMSAFRVPFSWQLLLLAVALCAIIWIRHLENIGRLLRGEEKPLL